ncbi:MAG TPA: hypothetical protein VNL71_14485 [Chloroflexota bacterium]|nr:hypothetical protein [Chloroflexota bacterium]
MNRHAPTPAAPPAHQEAIGRIRAILTDAAEQTAIRLQNLARAHGITDYAREDDPISGPPDLAGFDEARYTLLEEFWAEIIPTAHEEVHAILDHLEARVRFGTIQDHRP